MTARNHDLSLEEVAERAAQETTLEGVVGLYRTDDLLRQRVALRSIDKESAGWPFPRAPGGAQAD